MARAKIEISKEKLYALYHLENKTPYAIGRLLGCSFKTVTNRLSEYGIAFKSPSFARMRYRKYDFSGDLVEKAYLIGFRLGDLSATKTSPDAETIVVRVHTTHDVQIKLFKKLFENYGQISFYKNPRNLSTNVNAYLNNSFAFLLPKQDSVEPWIVSREKYFCAFAAGYIDAEGSFGVYQGKARFKIDTYDERILSEIHAWLKRNNVHSKFFRVAKQGDYVKYGNYHFKKEVWRINVNEANSFIKFSNLIGPYIQHSKRKADMEKGVKNIEMRKLKGSIK